MTSPKTALITGITGQDGSYLAELLLQKGYRVVGMTRRSSTAGGEQIEHLTGQIELVQGDLLDEASLVSALRETARRRSTTWRPRASCRPPGISLC